MTTKLGQHFLINNPAIKKIIAGLDLKSGETIIEIGPGEGALTFPLLEECKRVGCRLIAIEKDQQLAKKLGENIQLLISNFQIIEGDALKILPNLFSNLELDIRNWKLVGNIPYYITGKLLRILGAASLKRGEPRPENPGRELKLSLAVLMLQKEVAERIVARPPEMNLLAAAVQFWAEPKILFSLGPEDFNPPPEVSSAVIQLTTKPITYNKLLTTNYYSLIHILFKQPRKTIFNNLRAGLKIKEERIKNNLQSLNINPLDRPQNLSLEQIKSLVDIFQ